MPQLRIGDEFRQNLLNLLETTYIPILQQEVTQNEKKLAAVALREYMNVLSHLEVGFDHLPLLPASFQMYAQCVGGIMDALMSQFGDFMQISTFLSQPLARWYNLQEIQIPNVGITTFTTKEWEDYKGCIRRLKDAWQSKNADSPRIQLRRFVSRATIDAQSQLCVYVGDNTAANALRVDAARMIANRLPKSLVLPDVIKHTFEYVEGH